MGKKVYKKRLSYWATGILFCLVSILLCFPQPQASAAVPYMGQAKSYCEVQYKPQPAQTDHGTVLQPSPAKSRQYISYCEEGFLYALRDDATPPLDVPPPVNPAGPISLSPGPCYSQIYPGNNEAAGPCQNGYAYAYSNRNTILNTHGVDTGRTPEEQAYAACTDVVPQHLGNTTTMMNGCTDGYLGAKNGKSIEDACKKWTDAEKDKCYEGFQIIKPDAGPDSPGGADAAGDDETQSCSGEGLSLGWVLCPVVEVVSNFGQTVFQDYIQPMMEQNALSLKPDDPFYKSWQGFRFLGNVLLIGSLLAIVYSQTRGGS